MSIVTRTGDAGDTDDVNLRDRIRTAAMIPEAIMTRKAGASLAIRFDGTAVG